MQPRKSLTMTVSQNSEISCSWSFTMSPYIDLQKWRDANPRQSIPMSLFTIMVLIAAYHFVVLIHELFLSPLRKIPGPFLARITRWWEYVKVAGGDSHRDYIRLHEKYGS